ncbi:MAG TPA: carboxypeptidase-like regulatory domain-containing protein, partial [Blastocatellia bacterium]|nr:carboxypeptidase-like regulatory domain-containing protein [Blastocatellia bacterium]
KLVYALTGDSRLPVNGRRFESQQSLAQVTPGTVVDSAGAVIPDATVTIKDQNKGASRTVKTDSQGNYSVEGLPPGTYRIEVDAPGFEKAQLEDVAIQPGQVAAAGVQLSPGAVTEAVTVVSVSTAVSSTVSHTSSSYESKKLRELPSLAPVDSFARLVPGMTSREANEVNRQTGASDKNAEFRLWFNGGRPKSNNFSFNGQDNNDIDGRPSISINNFDSVDSLHVVTTRSPGDVGLTGATSTNLQTRAGTNEFHGTVFDYHLNRRLGALSPFERRSGIERAPEFKNTIYGGTVGGPILRDRAFFFGAFQGETESSSHFIDSTSSQLTPTLSGLERLSRSFPASATVSDLVSRGPLARPAGSPQTSRTFLLPVEGELIEFGQVTRLLRSATEGYEAGARFDFNLTRRDTLRAGYWYDSHSASNTVGRLAAGYPGNTDSRSQLASLVWNRLLSPTSSNEVRLGLNRSRLALDPEQVISTLSAQALSLPGVIAGPRTLAYGSNPFISSSHSSSLFEVSDVLSAVAGRHSLKLGAHVRRRLTGFEFLPGRGGLFTYASFDDFVRDRPAAIAFAIGEPRSNFEETHQHYFIDDSWRVRRNLTLSLGLSYENASQPLNRLAERLRQRESNPVTALFDTTLPLESRTIAPLDRDNNNFAPRIGFAYTPHFLVFGRNIFGYDRTVIRGGVSVSYDQTAYRPLAEAAASSPNILLASLTPASGVALPAFPHLPSQGELLSLLGRDARRFARTELDREYRTPLSSTWHLSVTRDLNERVVIETSYVGTRGVGLIRAIDADPEAAASRRGPLRVYETTGRSTYHSLQVRADARLTDQFSGGLAYTLSKLIDNVPDNAADIAGGAGDPASLSASGLQGLAQNPFESSRSERALSSFDRRHMLAAHFVYSLPLARHQPGVVGRLLGGWQASGIISLASGSPFTPLQFIGSSAASGAIFAAQFSDRLGAVRPFAANPAARQDRVAFSNAANAFYRFFLNADGTPFISPTGFIIADRSGFRAGTVDQARFVYNDYSVEAAARAMGLAPDAFGSTFAAGRRFGDAGRNTLIGPSLYNVDFALLKTTKLSEKVSLQFRAEFFNLFNHPNRARPSFILENAGGFGFADPGEVDASPRRIRLALKLIF